MERARTPQHRALVLIMLCWLVYTCSYIGKLSYSANISEIGSAYGVSYAETGMVSTAFFFVYGAGQIVNGILSKKYNVKYVVFSCLVVSSAVNFVFIHVPDFAWLKYLWLMNGASMSFLWTLMIRILSETLPKKDMAKATIVMGTTVATGTFIVYGLSALFVAVASYRITFYVASATLLAVALIWVFSFNGIVRPLQAERVLETDDAKGGSSLGKAYAKTGILSFIVVLAVFAVADNLIKDGLTTWTPDVLDETYDTPGWLSILLTMLLPLMAVFGTALATKVYKKNNSFLFTCILFFALTSLLILLVILFLDTPLIALTVACFAVVSCLMAGVNNVITSMMPLYMKDKIDAGKTAGILNGFCYLGSMLSSYGLGSIADAFGWKPVFFVLLASSMFVAGLGVVYALAKDKKHRY